MRKIKDTLPKARMSDIGYVEGTFTRLKDQVEEAFKLRYPDKDPNQYNIRIVDFEERVK